LDFPKGSEKSKTNKLPTIAEHKKLRLESKKTIL
jgi:hypothetical protein